MILWVWEGGIHKVLKFEEMFIKGRSENIEHPVYNNYSQLWEWQKFYTETKTLLEKTKNRKPIVDFKVRESE